MRNGEGSEITGRGHYRQPVTATRAASPRTARYPRPNAHVFTSP